MKITQAFRDRSDTELVSEANDLDHDLQIVQRPRLLRAFDIGTKLKSHNVLNLSFDSNDELKLEVKTFVSPIEAIKSSTALENDPKNLNAVYVRAENPSQLKSAYRNYFNDPVAFVELFDA